MEIGMNAYRKGYKGKAKHLKDKESLSDYQKKATKKKIKDSTKSLRDSVLSL